MRGARGLRGIRAVEGNWRCSDKKHQPEPLRHQKDAAAERACAHTDAETHADPRTCGCTHTLTRAHSLAYKVLSEGTIVLPKERDSEL